MKCIWVSIYSRLDRDEHVGLDFGSVPCMVLSYSYERMGFENHFLLACLIASWSFIVHFQVIYN